MTASQLLALALVTACQIPGSPREPQVGTPDGAEQIMVKVTTNVTTDGARRSNVVAESAFVYQQARRIEFRGVRATFFDKEGQQAAVLTAPRVVYQADEGTLDARGGVLLVTAAGDSLTTDQLVYDKQRLQFRTDTTFVYQSSSGAVRGKGFTADLKLRGVRSGGKER